MQMTSKCGTFPFRLVLHAPKQLNPGNIAVNEVRSPTITEYIPENIQKAKLNMLNFDMVKKVKLRDGISISRSLLLPNDAITSIPGAFSHNDSFKVKTSRKNPYEAGELEAAARELESLLHTSKELLPPWELVGLEHEEGVFYLKWKLCAKEFSLPEHQIIQQFLLRSKKMISHMLGDLLRIKPSPKTYLHYVPNLESSQEER